jgi:hypothetical protein
MGVAMLFVAACGSEVTVVGNAGGGEPTGGTGASGATNGTGLAGSGANSGAAMPGGGGIVSPECVDTADCPQPMNVCVLPTCVDGVCGTTRLPENAPCDDGAICAASGHCELIDGEPCVSAQYLCNSGPCVDGVCCENPCNGPCQACNLAGNEGACVTLNDC